MVPAKKRLRRLGIATVAVFSGLVNMLMLAGPLYMLQIYDRVLSARSVQTLVALSVFLIVAYGFQAALDVVRSRLVVRIGSLVDLRLAKIAHEAVIRLSNQNRSAAEAHQLGKAVTVNQLAARNWFCNCFVLEYPGRLMRDKYCVEFGGERIQAAELGTGCFNMAF